MKPHVDSDTQQIFDHMAEDPAKTQKNDPLPRRQRNSYGAAPAGKFPLLLGVGAAVLILLIILLARGSGKQDLTSIQTRLDQVEKRLALIDGTEKRIEGLENQLKSLQQAQSRLEASGKSMGERIDKLIRQTEKQQTVPVAAPKAKSSTPAATRVHEVQRGESLYSIAGKYGVPLDQILRLNNLKKDSAIQPGQKILIAPERP